ncbi:MAG: serine hydrolase [Alphaproteobacteria bacterium]|nr:serine hydrolase [Alphaproteobacteria bacterium]MBV9370281.1 serine hydrolase [Alphaproteobacteria bacterium]MBV9899766.1 serine hydrolase [Alphaproteobacteria bacterium]
MKAVLLSAALLLTGAASRAETPAPDLSGLWAATLRFGPDVRGALFLLETPAGWRADLAGYDVPVRVEGDRFSFALPDGKGRFSGRRRGAAIEGQWVQEKSAGGGIEYASPLTLRPDGNGRWRGEVAPLAEAFTWYLPAVRDGAGYSAYLRNPERNQGRFLEVTRMEVDGAAARLLGPQGGKPDATVAAGRYDPQSDILSLPLRGATFDFVREQAATSGFYPRAPGSRYSYRPPLRLGDGWPVGTLEEAGIDRAAIERLVQRLIDMKMEPGGLQLHSLLVARHGKLVLEEYFHGYERDRPHDIRSAGKSLTATLIGAAMASGVPITEDTPVYETMLGPLGPGADPRKKGMRLRHLMTMTSGHFCDDSNDAAPGNETVMQDQTAEPDYYRYILALPMDRTPGEKIVYCSVDAILAGGVLRKVAGEPLPEMFHRLVAAPLGMRDYYLNLTPTGELYTAGGWYVRPRDMLKLPQLMLNGGTWQGRRIVSRDWVAKESTPYHALNAVQGFGYFWNTADYPWRGRKVRAVFAAGNGGQIFLAIPELDLAIGFTAGNYAEPALLIPQRELVPNDILPAVR